MQNYTRTPALIIFCDGGIGNRINALISGLAIAKYFELSYRIHWPINNWCAAAFEDIFSNPENISIDSIKALNGKMGEAIVLLHDEIAAKSLGVTFESAYSYQSLEDFADRAVASGKTLFYYPAIKPDWIPLHLIHSSLQNLHFTDYICSEVTRFIEQTLTTPFHGLHLRRTDLKVGFSDHEVLTLLTQHPGAVFFVCSDDPLAEALASAHPHAHSRNKSDYVEKKKSEETWLAKSEDDDGRIYYGNIQRNKASVIEGAIDLLILAHSTIIGYSGSTFQSIARMIGEVCPLYKIDKPAALASFSTSELKRQVQNHSINTNLLFQICNTMGSNENHYQAIELLQFSIEYYENSDLNDILHTLGIILLKQNNPKLASIYLNQVVISDPDRYTSWLYLSYAAFNSKNIALAQFALTESERHKLLEIQDSEIYLADILDRKLKGLLL